ncbi:MAG: hypothetical protein MUP97_05460, partial [Acidimicrobiia bacterium]|nr:hypothetical protein [Acidimicrobiia bacterium]
MLIALAGGVVVAAAAGARRTDTAMDRFLADYRPDDGEVDTSGPEAAAEVAVCAPTVPDAVVT